MSAAERLDTTFLALADPTRRAILARLAQGVASVNELAEPFDMSQPAISKHLKMLERAGLVSRGRDAQRRPCRLEARPLEAAYLWIERYRQMWDMSFERLDTLLDELKSTKKPSKRRKSK
jgi:DNA-binding transcriptional ArsR family regulator